MTKPQHTPTPWDTKPTAGDHQQIIWDDSGKTIALVYTDASDAAFIVRACNAHDELVAALATLHEVANGMEPDRTMSNRDWAELDAAITKAHLVLEQVKART